MSGALSRAMIDAAIPLTGCRDEALAWIKSRKANSLGRAADIIQAHNKSVETKGNHGRCASCGSSASLIWG
jgi:hypothetical protein